jgi:hypothetical protein
LFLFFFFLLEISIRAKQSGCHFWFHSPDRQSAARTR